MAPYRTLAWWLMWALARAAGPAEEVAARVLKAVAVEHRSAAQVKAPPSVAPARPFRAVLGARVPVTAPVELLRLVQVTRKARRV